MNRWRNSPHFIEILDFCRGGGKINMRIYSMRKVFIIACLIFTSVGLFSCSNDSINDISDSTHDNTSNNQGSNTEDEVTAKEWNSVKDLYFGYGIKKSDLDNFFTTRGEKIIDSIHIDDDYYRYDRANTTVIYGVNSGSFVIRNAYDKSEVRDVEVTNAFGVTKVIKATVYAEYLTSIAVNYYDSMDKAVFGATYNDAIIDSNLEILDAQTGTYNYLVKTIGDGYILPNYQDVVVNKVESSFNIDSSVPSICYTFLRTSLNLFNDIVKELSPNYSVTSLYKESDWDNIDFDSVSFESVEVVYDGEPHSIYAINVPDGVKVNYSNNDISNPGKHEIKATFYDPKGREIGQKTATLFINDEFDITFKFYYGDNLLDEKTLKINYGSNLIEYATPYVPENYVIANESLDWNVIGDQTVDVDLMSVYEGYLKVSSSTNSELNGKLLSYELIDYSYTVDKNQLISMIPLGENNPVEFFLDEVTGIEFCNSLYIYSDFLYKTSKLENLSVVDISNMKYLTEIPDGFFYGCKNLKSVKGEDLNYLSKIGDNFLCNTNIVDFDVDLSNVTEIGRCFMMDALLGTENREITIDLPSLISINETKSGQVIDYGSKINHIYFLYQSKKNLNAVVNLKVYNFLLTDEMFKSYDSVFDSETQKLQYYSFVNLNVYTNRVSTQERLLSKLPGNVNIIALN